MTAQDEPLCIGDEARYTASMQGPDYFSSIKWYYEWNDCNPDKQEVKWMRADGQPAGTISIATQHDKLGSLTVRAVVTFAKETGGLYTSEKSITVTVLPPDKVALADPNAVLDVNVETVPPGLNARPNHWVAFNILRTKAGGMSGDRVLNCGGTPLEALDRGKYFKQPNKPLETGDFLYCTVGAILDGKGTIGDAGFAALNLGIYDEFDQTLALELPTGCGGKQLINFPQQIFHFQMDKVDGSHWQLHRPQP